jgi:outer membrane protein insertion porin family
MKETKKSTIHFKASKFIKINTKLIRKVIAYKKGYRDARILDSVTYDKNKNALNIKINVEENLNIILETLSFRKYRLYRSGFK